MIGGGWGRHVGKPAGVSEYVDTSAVDASLQSGVRINFIAKDGGNRFSGTTSFPPRTPRCRATTSSRGSGTWPDDARWHHEELDFSPGRRSAGERQGVVYLSGRYQGANTQVPGQYNLNANNPNA
jgi:hypothetical protein